MGKTEVQVLDNYNNPTYPDGFAGSIYGVMPPMANPLRSPGQWQSYDIIFRGCHLPSIFNFFNFFSLLI